MNQKSSIRIRSVHGGLALLVAGALLAAACGSDSKSSSETAAATTAAVPASTAAASTAAATTAAPATTTAGTDAPTTTGGTKASTTTAGAASTTAAAGPISDWQKNFNAMMNMSLDDLYQKAVAEEGGEVVFFNGNSVIPADRAGLGPAFQKVYPKMNVTLYGEGTPADMIAKVQAETQAGQPPSGDLFWASLENVGAAKDAKVVADWNPPEAAAYPDNLKGSFYVVPDFTFHGIAWNTNNVSDADAPKSFDDLLDPKWKGKIIAEPRIATQLTALASHRFPDQASAEKYATDLAAQDLTFIPRYPTLVQQLAAGEGDVCFNCNAYNTTDLINQGAPVKFIDTETMALPDAQMVFANAQHPYGAALFARWLISPEGQAAWVAGGRNAALPGVPSGAAIRPEKLWILTADDVANLYPTWNTLSKQLFGLQ